MRLLTSRQCNNIVTVRPRQQSVNSWTTSLHASIADFFILSHRIAGNKIVWTSATSHHIINMSHWELRILCLGVLHYIIQNIASISSPRKKKKWIQSMGWPSGHIIDPTVAQYILGIKTSTSTLRRSSSFLTMCGCRSSILEGVFLSSLAMIQTTQSWDNTMVKLCYMLRLCYMLSSVVGSRNFMWQLWAGDGDNVMQWRQMELWSVPRKFA